MNRKRICEVGIVLSGVFVSGAFAQLGILGGSAATATGAIGTGVTGAGGIASQATASMNARQDVSAGSGLAQSRDIGLVMMQNVSLSNRVQTLLPAGAGLASASFGFEDTATFLAAAHLAHNLNIPWEPLKAETTGKHRRSLARAIAQFRPDLDFASIRNSVKLAEREAAWDCNHAASAGSRDRVATRIVANTELAARVRAILPASVTVASAAAGFASEQEFLAAAEVSNMLQIDFPDLKDRLMAGQSLREAARQMKPEMSSESLDAGVKTAAVRGRDLRVESSASASASVRTAR